jgi:hypothetical protein
VFDPTIAAVARHRLRSSPCPAPTLPSCTTRAWAPLDGYLPPLNWGWGATLRRCELVTLLENVTDVDYVDLANPTIPATDAAPTTPSAGDSDGTGRRRGGGTSSALSALTARGDIVEDLFEMSRYRVVDPMLASWLRAGRLEPT